MCIIEKYIFYENVEFLDLLFSELRGNSQFNLT